MKKTALITIGIAIIVGVVAWQLIDSSKSPIQRKETSDTTKPPAGLYLPFNISDINEQQGVVNPLGVVRFSQDQPEYGHSGIDIPLNQGAPITAVSSGTIVAIKSSGDQWGGQDIVQLLTPTSPGEGWAYLYEHVIPSPSLKVGDEVKTGDIIATKAAPPSFTAHFQLSYVFNNYEFNQGMECWVELLKPTSKEQLLTWWEKYSSTTTFTESWRLNTEESKAPFRNLLDKNKFPEGPKLCYPPGTDVR